MTTPSTPTDITKNLNDAILTFSNDAHKQYYDAHDTIEVQPPASAPEIAAAQKELVDAFSKLSTAVRLESDPLDKDGFAAVVRLMQTTADAADKISSKLVDLLKVNPPTDYQHIDALTNMLDVLARLSPSSVWAAPHSKDA